MDRTFAPEPVPLELGGKVYKLSPMLGKHWGQLMTRLVNERPEPLDAIKGYLSKLTNRQQEIVLAKAFDATAQRSRATDWDVSVYLDTLPGMAAAVWLLASELDSSVLEGPILPALENLTLSELPRVAAALRQCIDATSQKKTEPPETESPAT